MRRRGDCGRCNGCALHLIRVRRRYGLERIELLHGKKEKRRDEMVVRLNTEVRERSQGW
jgi:Ni,Fe-hydrogenase III small subunit